MKVDIANVEDNNSLENSIKAEESEERKENSKEPLIMEQKEKNSFGNYKFMNQTNEQEMIGDSGQKKRSGQVRHEE